MSTFWLGFVIQLKNINAFLSEACGFVCQYVCLCINSLILISSLASGPLVSIPGLGYDSLLSRPSAKDVAEIPTAVVTVIFGICRAYA